MLYSSAVLCKKSALGYNFLACWRDHPFLLVEKTIPIDVNSCFQNLNLTVSDKPKAPGSPEEQLCAHFEGPSTNMTQIIGCRHPVTGAYLTISTFHPSNLDFKKYALLIGEIDLLFSYSYENLTVATVEDQTKMGEGEEKRKNDEEVVKKKEEEEEEEEKEEEAVEEKEEEEEEEEGGEEEEKEHVSIILPISEGTTLSEGQPDLQTKSTIIPSAGSTSSATRGNQSRPQSDQAGSCH